MVFPSVARRTLPPAASPPQQPPLSLDPCMQQWDQAKEGKVPESPFRPRFPALEGHS